jgi:hypothetical protein
VNTPVKVYRVEYEARGGERGHLLLRTAVTRTNSLEVRARGLLADQGIRARILRVIAVDEPDG